MTDDELRELCKKLPAGPWKWDEFGTLRDSEFNAILYSMGYETEGIGGYHAVMQVCEAIPRLLSEKAALEKRLKAAAELSRAIEKWEVHDAVAHNGHLQAGIEWASWTWLKERLAALAAGRKP